VCELRIAKTSMTADRRRGDGCIDVKGGKFKKLKSL